MRVCFIGDIVGKIGRNLLKDNLQALRERFDIELVIANSENASHGFGLTKKNSDELFGYGIDVMSGGNHSWDKKETLAFIESEHRLLRPINYPQGVPGRGSGIYKDLGVINIMGQYGMPPLENPFTMIEKEVLTLKNEGARWVVVDFHAESTAEKRVMYLMLEDKIDALLGTHTHIGTDDLTVDKGKLYVSDVGLTGCRDGVIGVCKEEPIKKFTTGLPVKFEIPNRCKSIFQAVVFELGDTGVKEAFKIRLYDNIENIHITQAYVEK